MTPRLFGYFSERYIALAIKAVDLPVPHPPTKAGYLFSDKMKFACGFVSLKTRSFGLLCIRREHKDNPFHAIAFNVDRLGGLSESVGGE